MRHGATLSGPMAHEDVMDRTRASATAVMLVMTSVSLYIGLNAITTAVRGLRQDGGLLDIAVGGVAGRAEEIADLIGGLGETDPLGPATLENDRDPMVPLGSPAPPRPVQRPSRPTVRFEVVAVILDEDPVAIIESAGGSIIVRIGDEFNGGTVAAIGQDGVTVTSDSGTQAYPYPPMR